MSGTRRTVSMTARLFRRMAWHAHRYYGGNYCAMVEDAIKRLMKEQGETTPPRDWDPGRRKGRPKKKRRELREGVGGIHSW